MSAIALKEYTIYNEEEILALYKAVEWSNYYKKPKMLEEAYQNSLYILGAYLEERLVGIIRVVGDGASIIFIQDLLVHPDYQRQKIGTQLLKYVFNRYENVYQKALLTENTEKTKIFYSKLGMTPIEEMNGTSFIRYTF